MISNDVVAASNRAWLDRWDRQQEVYLPDRERMLAAIVDLVEHVAGPEARVLDLACGCGSVADRLLRRLPGARIVAVDADPVLLQIARGALGEAVDFRQVDLRDPAWAADLDEVDAAVTAIALHWLSETGVTRVLGELAELIRPGGVFADADTMPLTGIALHAAGRAVADRSGMRAREAGAQDWAAWWQAIERDPAFADAFAERVSVRPDKEFAPGSEWFTTAARAAGFREAEVVWRSFDDAIVAAIR